MNQEKNNFWSRHLHLEAGFNLSWGAVIAGVVTFFAVFLLFSLITSAIGLGTLDPTSSTPFHGVMAGMSIGTIITLLIALFCGGFVAGLAARKTGLLHGFLTWALSLVLSFLLLTMATFSALGAAGRAASSVAGAVGNATGSVAGGIGNITTNALESLSDEIDIDKSQVNEETQKILRDTEIEQLQPEYLEAQLNEAKSETAQAAKDLAVNPENSDEIINNLTASLQEKIDNISANVDRDAVKNAVAKNTDLTEAEADEAVDNAIAGIEQAQTEASRQLENAKIKIEETKTSIEQGIEEGREAADEVTDKASGASVMLFVGLVVGAAIASFGGIIGSAKTRETIIQE
ncbi:MAG: hypothetical protein Q4P25_02055 [Tissierellia bacterium]|nr:hypothetical protein [Tissierellia bacterium]